ncbi:hypothetical protein C1Y40_04717 [Mycobacterium talmoniae]|uniref:Uncharacterized protein n=1 Tax=Mycobacterium talmoniae TaxID=1858794 RepID=A0A2S8BEN9_9MYCO|nr:hypothetical protein C1Y40_04717 [Mycobacterium talmoniae]
MHDERIRRVGGVGGIWRASGVGGLRRARRIMAASRITDRGSGNGRTAEAGCRMRGGGRTRGYGQEHPQRGQRRRTAVDNFLYQSAHGVCSLRYQHDRGRTGGRYHDPQAGDELLGLFRQRARGEYRAAGRLVRVWGQLLATGGDPRSGPPAVGTLRDCWGTFLRPSRVMVRRRRRLRCRVAVCRGGGSCWFWVGRGRGVGVAVFRCGRGGFCGFSSRRK